MTVKTSKKTQKISRLIQATLPVSLAKRFYASPEYQLHKNASAALREILNKALGGNGTG